MRSSDGRKWRCRKGADDQICESLAVESIAAPSDLRSYNPGKLDKGLYDW
jgi:hypothetical protein